MSESTQGASPSSTPVLKPCPFCGGEAELDEYGVGCAQPTSICPVRCYTDEEFPLEEAIKAWNTRATVPEQPVQKPELVGEVRKRLMALRLEVDSRIVDDIENAFNDLMASIIQPTMQPVELPTVAKPTEAMCGEARGFILGLDLGIRNWQDMEEHLDRGGYSCIPYIREMAAQGQGGHITKWDIADCIWQLMGRAAPIPAPEWESAQPVDCDAETGALSGMIRAINKYEASGVENRADLLAVLLHEIRPFLLATGRESGNELYLQNRADGVDGHYAIARNSIKGTPEFWLDGKWVSYGCTVFPLSTTDEQRRRVSDD